MRGFGVPQTIFALESAVDELALKMGIDPLELRLKNAFVPGDVTICGQTLTGPFWVPGMSGNPSTSLPSGPGGGEGERKRGDETRCRTGRHLVQTGAPCPRSIRSLGRAVAG